MSDKKAAAPPDDRKQETKANISRSNANGNVPYTLESTMRTFALKIYAEQIDGFNEETFVRSAETDEQKQEAQALIQMRADHPLLKRLVIWGTYELYIREHEGLYYIDEDAYNSHVEQLITGLVERIRGIPADIMQLEMIVHNRDYNHDDFWVPSIEKPHIHIIGRFVIDPNNDNRNKKRLRWILKMLGITYRKGVDEWLVRKHAVETCRDFCEYSVYLYHDTEDAIRDGKTPYDPNEVISNLSDEELQQIRDGYSRIVASGKRVSPRDLEALDDAAYRLGQELGDLEAFLGSQPFKIRSHSKLRTIRESYYRGVTDRINDPSRNSTVRLCVYIQGLPNTGKTYAAIQALKGLRTLQIGAGGTGKFDRLQASTQALLIDDSEVDGLLQISDNYFCALYRRNSDNPWWCGRYVIVTSNKDFDAWLTSCDVFGAQVDAVKSRFYICKMNNDGTLTLVSESTRGVPKEVNERRELFAEFRNKFEGSTRAYYESKNNAEETAVDILKNGEFVQTELTWDEITQSA